MGNSTGQMIWFLQQINSRKEAGERYEVEGGIGGQEVALDYKRLETLTKTVCGP